MSNLLYAAIVVFTEKHVISYEEVKNEDCFFFNDLHIRIKVLCVQNGFIRFKLYDFSKQNIPIGCFGIPLNEPILYEGLQRSLHCPVGCGTGVIFCPRRYEEKQFD